MPLASTLKDIRTVANTSDLGARIALVDQIVDQLRECGVGEPVFPRPCKSFSTQHIRNLLAVWHAVRDRSRYALPDAVLPARRVAELGCTLAWCGWCCVYHHHGWECPSEPGKSHKIAHCIDRSTTYYVCTETRISRALLSLRP